MARIRTIKPELATHEGLFDLEQETGLPIRFAWCMLFTACDREGRFSWRPRTLKAQILPHDSIDFSRVLDALLSRGFVVKYRVGHEWFGWIPTFTRHQVINNRESPSCLPSIESADETQDHRPKADTEGDAPLNRHVADATGTREVHAQAEGEGRKEGEGEGESAVADGEPSSKSPKRTRREKFDPLTMPIPPELDSPEFQSAWAEWCACRKAKGKPISEHAAKQQFSDFVEWGCPIAIQQIREAIRNDWQGVFPPKPVQQHRNGHANGDLQFSGIKSFLEGEHDQN